MMDNETALERRLRKIEDMLAIYQAISAYGPAVDGGALEEAAELWTEQGSYEVPGAGSFHGRAGIVEMLGGELHQSLIRGGCAHILSMPHVTIQKDRAVAINYGRVYVREEDGFALYRVIASRWEFVRTEVGWMVERRINQLLDGREEARFMLAQGIAESRWTASQE